MERADELNQLIGSCYAAALDRSAWQTLADELSGAYEGAAVSIRISMPGEAVRWYTVGLVEELLDRAAEELIAGLPWSPRLMKHFVGRFGSLGDVFPDEDLSHALFYADWMKPQKLPPVWPIGTELVAPDGLPVGDVTLYRSTVGRSFDEADLAFGDLLVPHLTRSMTVSYMMGAAQRARLALAEAMDRLPTGVILLDAQRRAVAMNQSAAHLIALDDGFKVGEQGPYAADPQENKALQKMLCEALKGEPGREHEVMAVSRPSALRAFSVMCASLLAAAPGSAAEDAVVAIYVSNPELDQAPPTTVLQTLYSLTRSEAELVRLLSEGHSLEEVAKMRDITMNTARSHLKHAFAKTDTRRQGELVRLVLTGVASIREDW